ncbi:MAG: hypothetical protein GY788_04380 [bacterium]|nr:hypothetical protein [bacterium]
MTLSRDGDGTNPEMLHMGIPDIGGAAVEHGRCPGEDVETMVAPIEAG